jgi:hypothetical protein
MRAGASSGLRSHGGKVVARVGLESHHAAGHAAVLRLALSSASMAWWPRCTPSKLPMVSAQAGAAGMVEASEDAHDAVLVSF